MMSRHCLVQGQGWNLPEGALIQLRCIHKVKTGNANIVVWKRTQQYFRQALMSAQLLLVTGTVETRDKVIHIIAGKLEDYTHELESLRLKSRNFH